MDNLNTKLLNFTQEVLPQEIKNIDWFDTWKRPVSNGIGFQWAIFFSLFSSLRNHGWTYSVPLLNIEGWEHLYILRNEIPLQHGSQPGHSDTVWNLTPLQIRFVQSLIPKATFSKNGKDISVFFEGCPYHKIMLGQNYLDRPDILIFPGSLIENYPRQEDSLIQYGYKYDNLIKLEGTLKICDSKLLPVLQRKPPSNQQLNVVGIVECSVNKSWNVIASQLKRYAELFSSVGENLFVFATGKEIKNYMNPQVTVPLISENDNLKQDLKQAGEYIYKTLISSVFE